MNLWLQTRLYECLRCKEKYTHDKAYVHNVFACVRREGVAMKSMPYSGRASEIKMTNLLMDQRFFQAAGCGVGSFQGEGETIGGERR
ncbi:MAG: hypothetical protein ABIU05_05160 [Nitrospirales bacterium]